MARFFLGLFLLKETLVFVSHGGPTQYCLKELSGQKYKGRRGWMAKRLLRLDGPKRGLRLERQQGPSVDGKTVGLMNFHDAWDPVTLHQMVLSLGRTHTHCLAPCAVRQAVLG